ncbi:MAG: substrate-binding domain-containing protein [Clostridiales bacterium]|nr:substrate-binding domain-containing protein [Clostridiales bacterium]MDY2728507.1 substrate-binding domain-containing protein [Clostridium sp.]
MGALAGCGSSSGSGSGSSNNGFDKQNEITVVSREDGSGTRGAFIELFGVEENKVDKTTENASITNNTSVMMTTVQGDKYAIGYASLGSLNDSVKKIKVDGVEATAENIKSGSYKIARPFNIAVKDNLSEVSKDFIDYILSKEGQDVVEKNGYIKVDDAKAYEGKKPSGKVVVAGSSSVSPVMEKLKEAYLAVNTNAEIEIQTSDSTTGVTGAIDGICDIGMASRDLKDSETSKGVKAIKIAMDGIAIIVNKDNDIEDISKDAVKKIYTGDITEWSEVK